MGCNCSSKKLSPNGSRTIQKQPRMKPQSKKTTRRIIRRAGK